MKDQVFKSQGDGSSIIISPAGRLRLNTHQPRLSPANGPCWIAEKDFSRSPVAPFPEREIYRQLDPMHDLTLIDPFGVILSPSSHRRTSPAVRIGPLNRQNEWVIPILAPNAPPDGKYNGPSFENPVFIFPLLLT